MSSNSISGIVFLLLILSGLGTSRLVYAATLVGQAQANVLLSGLSYPVSLDFAPGGRIFFNEKTTGNVRIIQGGTLLPTPFATLSVSTAGPEQGLLGIRLDPNFSSNGFVYVYATVFDGTFYHGHITRFTAVGNLGTSPTNIFDVTDPTPATTNHDGGYMKFGQDGKLYVQVGEFAVQNLSQNLTSNAGKVLRMNSDGSVPVDNPFPGSLVYAYGFRNGFGMDFDPATGRLIGTEAGPDRNDKVEFIIKGGNYCWPLTSSARDAIFDRVRYYTSHLDIESGRAGAYRCVQILLRAISHNLFPP